MNEQIQIFSGSDGLDIPDFYPDDLPIEWRFDYYSTNNLALMLPINTNEDLEEILEEIDEEFKLVLEIDNAIDIKDVKNIVDTINDYKDKFILFSKTVDVELIAYIKNYNFCIESDKKITGFKNIENLYFNNFAIFVTKVSTNERDIRHLLENLLSLNENIVLIHSSADYETLDKANIISNLLVF